MALYQCPGCNNRISKEARTCPKCGKPLKKSDFEQILFYMGLGAVAFFVWIAWGAATTPRAQSQALGFIERVAGVECYADDLKVVKSVRGPNEPTRLEKGDQRYIVKGTVRDRDKNRYTVRVVLAQVQEGKYWRLDQLYMGRGVGIPVEHLKKYYDGDE